jgi:sulfatase maturation enzyme AslB (radical SAM superfamily)
MQTQFFRYKAHPGDFFRNTNPVKLPNPEEELEDFLVQFLPHYQSDERLASLDDLTKYLDNELLDETLIAKIKEHFGSDIQEQSIKKEIERLEKELIQDAYKNFYSLVSTNKIELLKIVE